MRDHQRRRKRRPPPVPVEERWYELDFGGGAGDYHLGKLFFLLHLMAGVGAAALVNGGPNLDPKTTLLFIGLILGVVVCMALVIIRKRRQGSRAWIAWLLVMGAVFLLPFLFLVFGGMLFEGTSELQHGRR